jgi:transcriptional regulator GlxA family with amidase domain
MPEARTIIVFPIYPDMTQLDFTGPHQVLTRLPDTRVVVASARGGTVVTGEGLAIADTVAMASLPRCDVICVPGGTGFTGAIEDSVYMAELRRLAASATYVTSVCTGSLILGATGMLRGKRAACHWAWRDLLAIYGAIADSGRVVRDGNIFTGGGVTAGIDFALVLAAEIAGPETAQAIQLALEYAPAPPFDAGRPETASPAVLALVEPRFAGLRATRVAAVQRAAARMDAGAQS